MFLPGIIVFLSCGAFDETEIFVSLLIAATDAHTPCASTAEDIFRRIKLDQVWEEERIMKV